MILHKAPFMIAAQSRICHLIKHFCNNLSKKRTYKIYKFFFFGRQICFIPAWTFLWFKWFNWLISFNYSVVWYCIVINIIKLCNSFYYIVSKLLHNYQSLFFHISEKRHITETAVFGIYGGWRRKFLFSSVYYHNKRLHVKFGCSIAVLKFGGWQLKYGKNKGKI